MASMDLYNNIITTASLHPAARTVTANGAGVDLKGFHSAVAVIVAGAWTDGTHSFAVEESDDDITYTAVAAADLQGTEPVVDGATDDDQTYEVGYLGSARYLRVAVAVAGAPVTGLVAGAAIVRSHKAVTPTR